MSDFEEFRRTEENLFSAWALEANRIYGSQQQFVKDGVVEPERYFNSKRKTLFLLKEVHEKEGESKGWDLCEEIRNGAPWSGWRNWDVLARWTHDILAGQATDWNTLTSEVDSKVSDWLRNIALVNVKKSGGGASTDPQELWDYSQKFQDPLRAQVSLYQPDLIVYCGTGNIGWDLFKPNRGEEFRTSRNVWGHKFQIGDRPCVGVGFYHFGARYPHNFLHYGLVDAVQQIFSNETLQPNH